MRTKLNGHSHGGKAHLTGMLAVAGVVLVVLLAAGRSFGEALPLAAALACPLMMIGMMFAMGRGQSHHGSADNASCHGDDEPVHWDARRLAATDAQSATDSLPGRTDDGR